MKHVDSFHRAVGDHGQFAEKGTNKPYFHNYCCTLFEPRWNRVLDFFPNKYLATEQLKIIGAQEWIAKPDVILNPVVLIKALEKFGNYREPKDDIAGYCNALICLNSTMFAGYFLSSWNSSKSALPYRQALRNVATKPDPSLGLAVMIQRPVLQAYQETLYKLYFKTIALE